MSITQHLLSGGLSGFTSVLCLQPLDLLKTRLQQNDGSAGKGDSTRAFQVALRIVKQDGFLGLWRGTTPTMMRNVPGVALYFSILQKFRESLSKSPHFQRFQPNAVNADMNALRSSTLPVLTSQGNLLAGATARVTVGILLNPVSVVKARYESDIHSLTGVGHALKTVFQGGPRELLRGAGASALRDAPYAGLFIFFYENIKREFAWLSSLEYDIPPTLIHTVSGAGAGTLATLLTHPFDVLKTKIQVRTEKQYASLPSAVIAVWRQRGPSGFFDGLTMRMSRKIMSSAVGWAIYEGILLFMQERSAI